jgi:hypothetical protein
MNMKMGMAMDMNKGTPHGHGRGHGHGHGHGHRQGYRHGDSKVRKPDIGKKFNPALDTMLNSAFFTAISEAPI